MFLTIPGLCLIFFFLAASSFLFQYSWVVFILQILAVLIALPVIIWCTFQTLDIYHYYFNIRKAAIKKDALPSAIKFKQENYRKSTYKPIASGWYPLCWSDEVKKGEAIKKHALGTTFAIFRGRINGEVGILDAYCPHIGADLTAGGKVCGDTLECPMHLWKFDKNGICKDIPYLKDKSKIPKNANAKSYPCYEYHDMICTYYDSHGNNNVAYHLPIQHDLLNKSEYSMVDKLDYGVINMHVQEFVENTGDYMHFGPIHGRMMFPFTQIEIPYISRWLKIHHQPSTLVGGNNKDSIVINKNKYGPDNKYFLYFINKPHLTWNGKTIPNSHGIVCVKLCGPAGIVIFKMSIPSFDPNAYIYIMHTHLPEDEINLRVRFHWYAHNSLPRLLVWYVVGSWVSQWTNDLEIWENKIFLTKPCLVRGDGPISKVRRWFKQFYPDKNLENKENKKIKLDGADDDENKENKHDEMKENNNNIDW